MRIESKKGGQNVGNYDEEEEEKKEAANNAYGKKDNGYSEEGRGRVSSLEGQRKQKGGSQNNLREDDGFREERLAEDRPGIDLGEHYS